MRKHQDFATNLINYETKSDPQNLSARMFMLKHSGYIAIAAQHMALNHILQPRSR